MALPLIINIIACTGSWAGLVIARCAMAAGATTATSIYLDALVFVSTMFLICGALTNTKAMFMGAAMFGLTCFTWPFFDAIGEMHTCAASPAGTYSDAYKAAIAGEFILGVGSLVVGGIALFNIFFDKSDTEAPPPSHP
ncbi:hypothetical protein Pelo_3397 [Pelomyxa schiedti]|nr:hypothetical protein Pelo_3397 [Pelomyxa schiedti]